MNSMKRLELFEFEDYQWLPKSFRSGMTNLIMVFHKMLGTSEVLGDLILEIHKTQPFDQIVDIGSGSGGAMINTISKINNSSQLSIQLLLTDKYPDPKVVANINSQNIPNVSYQSESLNAKNIEDAPSGLKTMIASFHHMSPTIAKEILNSAEKSKETFLVYEIAKNNIPVIAWWLLLPISLTILILMSLVMTPFVKPLRFSQLFFTYIIPVIPLLYAWDGQASLMRTYTFKDIDELIGENKNVDYIWKIAEAKNRNGKTAGYYIFGKSV